MVVIVVDAAMVMVWDAAAVVVECHYVLYGLLLSLWIHYAYMFTFNIYGKCFEKINCLNK